MNYHFTIYFDDYQQPSYATGEVTSTIETEAEVYNAVLAYAHDTLKRTNIEGVSLVQSN